MRLFIGDTETTGLGPDRKAIEIAMIEVDEQLNILGEAETLLDPQCEISAESTAVHGISYEQVADCPTFDEWMEVTWGGKIEGEVALIGFRVAFDKPLIEPMFDQGLAKVFDVLPLAQTHIKGVPNHKLQTLREHLRLPGGPAHRAMGDVLTTLQLLQHLLPLSGRPLHAHLATPMKIVHKMPWGKHAGKLLVELPKGYRDWLLVEATDIDPNLRLSLELIRHTDFNPAKKGTFK